MRYEREPLPSKPPSDKLKKILVFVSVLILVYLYVFVYSPASCNNVRKRIDKTVEEKNPGHISSTLKGDNKKIPAVNSTSLDMKIPLHVLPLDEDEIGEREYLAARTIEGKVKRREKFTDSLVRNGVQSQEARRIIATFESRNVFNFQRAQPGQKFKVRMNEDGSRIYFFQYHYGSRILLEARRVKKSFKVRKIKHRPRTIPYVTGFSFKKTLKSSISSAGENYSMGLKIKALLRDEIAPEMFTDGDRFIVVIEKRMLKKKFRGYGELLALYTSTRARGEYRIFSFKNRGYYTYEGISFFRTYLPRPIEGNMPPEPDAEGTGVVFPARGSIGVRALGPGKIHSVKWEGALGRRVDIIHSDGILTSYYHLSRYKTGIKEGVSIERGEVLGYTGYSGTTPDKNGVGFRGLRNGKNISIYTIRGLRKSPVAGHELNEFHDWRNSLNEIINKFRKESGNFSASLESDARGLIRHVDKKDLKGKKKKKSRKNRKKKKRKH
ncbi:MAG: M23 family metallopeptidase [Deltaproteobacteria bacterium]|nr:M23 family metallopeptidase [Deltaproteobacteria bacterium]